MRLITKLVLAFALVMAAAPVVGLADDPFPGCWPCPSTVAK